MCRWLEERRVKGEIKKKKLQGTLAPTYPDRRCAQERWKITRDDLKCFAHYH